MAISASAKSRAAAVSALIKRDSGYNVQSSSNNRHTGIKIFAGDDLFDGGWPHVFISDPWEREADDEGAKKAVSERLHCITRDLARRGYTFEYSTNHEENTARIKVTGKAAKGELVNEMTGKVDSAKEFRAEVVFRIPDLAGARAYLGEGYENATAPELAQELVSCLWEMIGSTRAYEQGAIELVRSTLMK